MNEDTDKIISIAEELGWSVCVHNIANGKCLEFEQYTDWGQDFMFCVELDEDPQVTIDNIYKYWEDFDIDEETALWIGEDGHGKNGAPYRISDILKDGASRSIDKGTL